MSAPAALRARPLDLPAISRDTLSARNVLCRRRKPVCTSWLGQEWSFRLRSNTPDAPSAWWVECDWGGAKLWIGLSEFAGRQLAAGMLDDTILAPLPAQILLACLESALDELSTSIESATRKHVQLTNIDRPTPAPAGLECHGWLAQSGGTQIEGELMLDVAASRFLAAALREQPLDVDDSHWQDLGIRASLLIGWADLAGAALSGLELRDVVMLDECFLSRENTLLMQVAPTLGLRCELTGQQLRVIEGVHEIMLESEDSGGAADGILDDVPVRLTFDIGEREIALGELRTLQPGYLFNLGRDPRSTVHIRANGRVIGEGELVDIEGRVGVSILRLGIDA